MIQPMTWRSLIHRRRETEQRPPARLPGRALFLTARSLAWLAALAGPLAASAQEIDVPHDARLEGYPTPMLLEGGIAMTWVLFIVLGVLCVSVLFKNAKRSHLD